MKFRAGRTSNVKKEGIGMYTGIVLMMYMTCSAIIIGIFGKTKIGKYLMNYMLDKLTL